jgi:hypothetical protein
VVGVQRRDRRAHGRAERSGERRRQRLDHGYVEAEFARRRRHLGADEAGADDREPVCRQQLGAQRTGVVDGPQRVHAGEVFGAGQRAGDRASGQDDAIRPQFFTAFQLDRQRPGSQCGGGLAEYPPRAEVFTVEFEGQVDLLSGEELLRQRRPVVRAVRLGADDDELAVEARLSQRPHGRQPRERRSDHHDPVHDGST